MPYSLVCFDMDGVLYSSEKILGPVYQDAVAAFAETSGNPIDVPSLETILEEIGKPVPVIFANLFPNLPEEQRIEISTNVLTHLTKRVQNKEGELLEGAKEVLQELHKQGIKTGLASNGRAPYLNSILKTYGLVDLFSDTAFVNKDTLPTKGSLIVHYMNHFSISPEATLMVGDRLADYEAAQEAGVDFAMMTGGHGSDFTDEPVTYAAAALKDLLPVILGDVLS